MKKKTLFTVLLSIALLALTGCSEETTTSASTESPNSAATRLSGIVRTGGSTSVEKVMNALIYQFQENNREVTVNFEMNGSGDGIKNTLSGLYEIGHSSRDLKTDGSEDGLDVVAYAIDGIAVIIHKNNIVETLTAEQIAGIYTGEIKNWSEVGGKDAQITVVTREASSGTRSAFAEIIGLEKKDAPETNILATATTCDSTGAVQTTVTQNENAIGYMSFSEVDSSRVTPVKYNGAPISEATLKDGSYALKREFYLLTKQGETLSSEAKAFIDFVMSSEGQKLVQANNLLPAK